MRSTTLFSIDRTVEVVHYPEARAIVGHWQSLSNDQARPTFERMFDECERLGILTWIVDMTLDPGVPSQADLKWIAAEAIHRARAVGLVALVNIHGESALARMGARRWTEASSDFLVHECESLDEAMSWACEIAAKHRPS